MSTSSTPICRLEGPHQAVGALAHTGIGPGADRHVAVDAGAAAEPVAGGAVGQVDLLHIAAGGEVLGAFEHLNHAGAALAEATAVV